jgi:hypothetical protein
MSLLEKCQLKACAASFGTAQGVAADLARPLKLHPDDAAWIFHQPFNVLLLCANCHTLYDGRQYTDVTIERIVTARDVALRTTEASVVIREYFCQGYRGSVGRIRPNPVILNIWMPLLGQLQEAYKAGLLPRPHRLRLSTYETVDFRQALITTGTVADPRLPLWGSRTFK